MLEKPDEIVLTTIEIYDTKPDLDTLRRISEVTQQTKDLRDSKIEELQRQVDVLTKQARDTSDDLRTLSGPNPAIMDTLSSMGEPLKVNKDTSVFKVMNAKSVELDSLKVSLAKKLTDLESSISHLNMQKVSLARTSEEVAQQKEQALATNISANYNSNSMKISLYKSLGVHIEEQADEDDKVVVFGRAKNNTSVLQVDEKYLDYFISNYIWERLGDD